MVALFCHNKSDRYVDWLDLSSGLVKSVVDLPDLFNVLSQIQLFLNIQNNFQIPFTHVIQIVCIYLT